MMDRLAFLWPEITLFIGTCVVMVLGLSPRPALRRLCAPVCIIALAIAGYQAATTTPEGVHLTASAGQLLLPSMPAFIKVLVAIVGILMALLMAGTVDRQEEKEIAAGTRRFDALRTNRAEFWAFFLFSLTGLMLCASADDLIWLFLALELTSLPTYILVTISSARNRAREAGVKYFFLGALGAAIFLYGFAMLYGGTGSTNLNVINQHFQTNGINAIAMAGLLLSFIGICFKIAAVPMHFYTADVYEGASSPVSAFLAFVPKTAGMVAILLLAAAAGWTYSTGTSAHGLAGFGALATATPTETGQSLPEALRLTIWVVAALTMTVGNVLALWQTSVKRMLAYSSIAHSGYMLVGVIAGPGTGEFGSSGVSAVMLYLLCYGVMNLGAFAVIACLERPAKVTDSKSGVGEESEPSEADSIEDLRGLWKSRPGLAAIMVISSLGLLGFPPLLGFWGKYPLFSAGISSGEIILVLVLAVNSAISAFYYLRLVTVPFLSAPVEGVEPAAVTPFRTRIAAGALSAGGVIVLSIVVGSLMQRSQQAGEVGAFLPEAMLVEPSLDTPISPPAADADRTDATIETTGRLETPQANAAGQR
jgi:NADH-quinone oxidoreductase subunit N